MVGWKRLATRETLFRVKKSDWLKLFETCFKFVSFFFQPNLMNLETPKVNRILRKKGHVDNHRIFEGKTKIATTRKFFWGKKSEWFKLFKICFKFVSFFLKQSSEFKRDRNLSKKESCSQWSHNALQSNK